MKFREAIVEQDYWKFYQKEKIEEEKEDIEYLGINISSDRGNIEFKLYYNNQYSRKDSHPIVDKLDARNMIRTLTQVIDTKNGVCRRYDIGLGNRTNDRMEELLSEIEKMAPFCAEHKEEIRTMSQMKVCEDPIYALAAFYFLGFIEKEEQIEAMKMHYLTRICENPDKLGKKVVFDDAYYLDYLEQMKVSPFRELLPVVRAVVNGNEGILWMIGVDYFREGNCKYKIYFKTPSAKYVKKLKQALENAEGESRKLVEPLGILEGWLEKHEELAMAGVAVCLDSRNCWSLNFYFEFINGWNKDGNN